MFNRTVMFFIIVIVITYASISYQQKNSLNGKHIRVTVMEFPASVEVKRNAMGDVIEIGGILIHHLEALSTMFNFSYSYVFPNASRTEDSPIRKDGIYYLINNEADYFLSSYIGVATRLQIIDYSASFHNGPFGCIVPYPKVKWDIQASLKPFTYVVWITIASTALAIVLYLNSVIQIEIPSDHVKLTNSISVKPTGGNGTRQITDFVLGNLVSQGQRIIFSRLNFRIAAGAWCTGCFFLVQIYCSTLTSHLTATNQKPIANSVSELANTPGVSLTADKEYALDTLLQSAERGDFKRLADKFKINPKLLCNTTTDCLEIVKGGNAAYGAPIPSLKAILKSDLKRSGKCNYYLMREKFLSSNVFTTLPKNSPYKEIINIGILRFHQFGFYEKWIRMYVPEPYQCMELTSQKNTTKLSLGHLSSAFVILLAGYLLSIITFKFEKLIQLKGDLPLKHNNTQ